MQWCHGQLEAQYCPSNGPEGIPLRHITSSCRALVACSPSALFHFFFRHLAEGAILDSHKPNQYGPRGLGGGIDLAEISASVESMADDAREKGDREHPPADEAALSARFKRLGEQLGHVQPERPAESSRQPAASDPSAMARGFRLSTELVAGVLVGAAFGWVLDHLLGISPWGLIVFLLLGFTAGVLNVMRAAGVAPSGPLDPKR
jgi:ATP synthase protein I